jgi:glycosyltransferase involved in cell wall biosynthesis
MRLHLPTRSTIRRLRDLQPDVVQIHAEFNPENWWPPRIWSCPFVLSPHGAFHPAVLQRVGRRKAVYLAAARRALYGRITCFHGLNPSEEADIRRVLPWARTYVVGQGPSPAVAAFVADPSGVNVPDGQRSKSGPVRLLYLGRLDVEPKGLDILLQAFATALRDGGTPAAATLTMVGPDTGGGADRLLGLARRLGVEHAVQIRDPVPQAEVPSTLQECDVYVQLSRNEGSPLSLNDALFMGKPAIVSDRVGTVSDPGVASLEHVLVVDPTPRQAARAIAEAVEGIERLNDLAREGLPRVRRMLSWKHVATSHLELYSALSATSRS